MFRKWLTFLVILLVAAASYAGDPWKDKTYKEWDEKDARRILNDSPWAKPVSVTAMWRGSPGEGADATGKAENQPPTKASESAGFPAAGAGSQSADRAASQYPQLQYIVRWFSARTVVQARARISILRGASEAEAEKIIQSPVTEHQIVVVGEDMSPFSKADEMGLKEKSFLKLKKTKQKLSPGRVEIIRSEDGKRIAAVVLHFPMKSESGEPAVAPDEKGIEFECRAGPLILRTTFEPQKMVSKAGPDL